ncbi:MAG: sugar phosphate isomerase/epimerase [Candidatus Omnitrophica bacterium]|nr:sugar phosphate isomerase/epimerase [Candidatus Omnitrophota bacterium]
MNASISRRTFIHTTMAAAVSSHPILASASASSGKRNIKLGFDNFSIRSLGWNALQILDYAGALNVDVVMFSDLDVYESLEESHLKTVKQKADQLGIELHAGTGGVCPSSSRFNGKYGSAEEHLALVIRVAKILGSPVARCYQGSMDDRKNGEIYRHIKTMVQTCKKVRSQAVDAGVKIAIENHAGDMQAWELAMLIEEAGKDYVGATMDCGNAIWAIEDPMTNLEILGPYAVSSGMRDDAVWASENGAWTAWANMGDGHIDWIAYLDAYEKLCPNVPFILEIISGAQREFPYLKPEFWSQFPKAKADQFARFVAMAQRGKPFEHPADRPSGERSTELAQRQQKFDLEQSLKYCKEKLGLGMK